MQRSITIRNLDSLKYRVFTFSGAFLMLLALVAWLMDWPNYIAYIAAACGVAAFTVLSMDSFTSSNLVSIGGKSVTMKFLGSKTIGFLFDSLQEVLLLEQGLLIKVNGMEDVKLSRKRYKEQSLKELHDILIKKMNNE